MKPALNSSKGFTLVELLVVMVVISTLAGVVITIVNPQASRRRAQDAIKLSNMQKLVEGIEAYKASEGSYPTSAAAANITKYVGVWPDGNPEGAVYSYSYTAATIPQFGLLTVKSSDTRRYKYRSEAAWGRRVRECAASAVITNTACP